MLTQAAQQQLVSYGWPGNVRQLRNVLERASILAGGGVITSEHLRLPPPAVSQRPTTEISEIERRTIVQVLRETDGNKSRAARRLGLTRTQLYVRLRRYALTPTMEEDAF